MQNQSKKRHNSQPLEGTSKDARSEQREVSDDPQADDTQTWSQVAGRGRGRGGLQTFNRFGLLSQANSYPDRTMRSASISSRAGSTRSTRGRGTFQSHTQQTQSRMDRPDRPADLGENTRFVTPEQNGPIRDEIVVECRTLNDRPFKGTVTFREATDVIFTEVMGFQLRDLYSVRMKYSGCPTVRFKLKEQTNIDDLRSVEHFNFERRAPNSNEIDYIACKILGIRGMASVPHYDGGENDVRWVKIEGCDHQLTEEQIRYGLEPYGELLTPIREDIHDDSDSEREIIGNGTYSVKMKLQKPIPQFLPMHSKRIRIYHNGISKLCSNCYGHHTRRQCRNEKRPWIEYVRDFMLENDGLGAEYYGKWWDIIDNEYPGYFDQNQAQRETEELIDSNPTVDTSSERRQRSVTRFADSRPEVSRPSRDPRINRTNSFRHEKQTHPTPKPNYDRQTEMSRLLANGLTLTEARKYLDNKEEMADLENRMKNINHQGTNNQSNTQTSSSRGRGQSRIIQ